MVSLKLIPSHFDSLLRVFSVSNFISSMFLDNTIKSQNGIKNDKSWSATKALASL